VRPDRPVLVFDGDDLARRERARRSFQQRCNAAVITVFRATGMRLPGYPQASVTTSATRRAAISSKGP
jgi:hypothetical protein